MTRLACLKEVPRFTAGSQPPIGYVEWFEWAAVQHKAGLRQKECKTCGLWFYPQEKHCASKTARGMVK
jgi:uncharacterized OB-fold protein